MASRYVEKLAKFITFCDDLAGMSTCKRLRVGCIIFPDDLTGILAIGYNGRARGESNDACTAAEGDCGCIHAEANALLKLKGGQDLILYTTISPCEHCAGLIINSGAIAHVMYRTEYRDTRGLARLTQAGIRHDRISK